MKRETVNGVTAVTITEKDYEHAVEDILGYFIDHVSFEDDLTEVMENMKSVAKVYTVMQCKPFHDKDFGADIPDSTSGEDNCCVCGVDNIPDDIKKKIIKALSDSLEGKNSNEDH